MDIIDVIRKSPTPEIREGTFILSTEEDCGRPTVCVFAQISSGLYKWINLDGNRQDDEVWTLGDVIDGKVDFPNTFGYYAWGFLQKGDSFTVVI